MLSFKLYVLLYLKTAVLLPRSRSWQMTFYEPNTSHISFVKVLLQRTLLFTNGWGQPSHCSGRVDSDTDVTATPKSKSFTMVLSETILPNLHLTYTTWYWQTGNLGKRINTVSANKNHLAKWFLEFGYCFECFLWIFNISLKKIVIFSLKSWHIFVFS